MAELAADQAQRASAPDSGSASPERSDPLRILMIAPQPFFRVRGTPFSVLHRIRALLEMGHQVDLVTYPFGEDPELEGLTLHRAGRPPGVRDVPIGPSLQKVLLDIPLFLRALRLAQSESYDLVHTHEEAGMMGAWIGRRFGLPHLYDMHSSLPQQFDNFGRFNWPPIVSAFRALESYTLRGSDGIIAICRELKDHVDACGYGGPVEVIENTRDVAPPAYDASDERALRNRLGLGSEQRVVLYTGTFEAYQGLPLLVRSVAAVTQRKPETRFVLVGGTAGQIEDLRQLAAKEGVQESVHLVPKVPPEQVFLFHRIADALVTTRIKGTNTPLKIYQYLRAGLPIVATDIDSHTQVLSAETAELVDPEPADVGRGILKVLEDRGHAARLAENARRLAREEYSEQAYMEKLVSLLEDVMATGRPSVAA